MLKHIKSYLSKQKIDFLYLTNTDEFFNEYLPQNQQRIQAITGFSGSNAEVIFGVSKSYFFTDGRYLLQAQKQLDLEEYEIIDIAQISVIAWLKSNLGQQKIAIFSKLSSIKFVSQLEKIPNKNVKFIEEIFIDELWQDRPLAINSRIFSLSDTLSGMTSINKRKLILSKVIGDALLITRSDDLCWLLNIRAKDLEYSPLLLKYAILYKDLSVDLFIDEKKIKGLNIEKINCVAENCLDLRFKIIRKTVNSIDVDFSSTNYFIFNLLQKNNFIINDHHSPIQLAKAVKNNAEIAGIKKAHYLDGLALVKFILWFKKIVNQQAISEIEAQKKLLEFRKENNGFFSESFATISGFASNSAIIHYHAVESCQKKIEGNSLYLIDSGGQYFGHDFMGTTDITRTLLVGKVDDEMIKYYTLVLKGHLALARVKFPKGLAGLNLDSLARFYLWQFNLDYQHGTGHGVGAFLGVHEGPCAISSRNNCPLLPNMVLSNEPGFYLANKYGIRLENLQRVVEVSDNFLGFETLSFAPFEPELVDFKMLTYPEKKWLGHYHQTIMDNYCHMLDDQSRTDLVKICQPFITKF